MERRDDSHRNKGENTVFQDSIIVDNNIWIKSSRSKKFKRPDLICQRILHPVDQQHILKDSVNWWNSLGLTRTAGWTILECEWTVAIIKDSLQIVSCRNIEITEQFSLSLHFFLTREEPGPI